MSGIDSKTEEQQVENDVLPEIILGSMEFGRRLDLKDSTAITEKFLSAGHRAIDTGYVYGGGETECWIGTILSQTKLNIPKDKIRVETKVSPFSPGGLSKQGVESQLNTSLSRLKTKCVDLLYLHAPDYDTNIEETLEGINQLYKEKKFKRFGLSNFPSWQVAEVYYICKLNKYEFLPTVYQGMYNPLTRDCENELFACLRKLNISFYAFNIIAGGLLSGKHKKYDAINDADNNIAKGRFHGKDNFKAQVYRQRYWQKSYFNAIDIIQQALNKEKIENKNDTSLIEASMRWMQHHSMLTNKYNDGVIIGASTVKHFQENIKGLENKEKLPKPIVDAFEEAWNVCKRDSPPYCQTKAWHAMIKAMRKAKK